jgi:polyisoprenoid-binding protein YceI
MTSLRNCLGEGGLLVSLLVSLQAAPAPGLAQTVLYEKSSITCVSRQMNVPVEARFRKFTADIAFDPAKPAAGKARIEIDMDSFDIDNAEFNDDAKSKAWFAARDFPRATFVAAGIRALGGGRFEVRGPQDPGSRGALYLQGRGGYGRVRRDVCDQAPAVQYR